MEKYVRYFEKENNLLKLYIKIPLGKTVRDVMVYFKNKYDDGWMSFLDSGIDITGKYVILNFVLRNDEDIRPYIEECNRLKEDIVKATKIIDEYADETENSIKKIIEYQEKYLDNYEEENQMNELYEKYVNQIKAVGQHLIDNAENILNDFETEHIREINIASTISYQDVPTVEINKSYVPRKIFE